MELVKKCSESKAIPTEWIDDNDILSRAQTTLKEVGKISETAIKELPKDKIENIKSAGDGVLAKLDDIKNLTPEKLKMQAKENITKKQTEDNSDANESINIKELTDEEKRKIKKETGWSDEIINRINSMEQYEIYKNAGLIVTHLQFY